MLVYASIRATECHRERARRWVVQWWNLQRLRRSITATECSLRTLWTQLLAMDMLVVKQPSNSISMQVAATHLLITSHNIYNINNHKEHLSLPTLLSVRVLPPPSCNSLRSATSLSPFSQVQHWLFLLSLKMLGASPMLRWAKSMLRWANLQFLLEIQALDSTFSKLLEVRWKLCLRDKKLLNVRTLAYGLGIIYLSL